MERKQVFCVRETLEGEKGEGREKKLHCAYWKEGGKGRRERERERAYACILTAWEEPF